MTTRPDVLYAVGMLTRSLAFPTDELLKVAERVLIYLYNTRTLAITYRSSIGGTSVHCNWAPTLGPVIDCDSDASLRQAAPPLATAQQSVALSTCEAEIMAGSLAAWEAVHLRSLLTELGFPPQVRLSCA
eukprot:6176980-Pleurochrysis_carterae.AAC.5